MLGIAMTTAPRPTGASYHRAALASLRNAGFDEVVHLCAEPETDIAADLPNIEVHLQKDEKLGCFKNWVRAATLLTTTGVEWCMILQDDVQWRADAAGHVYAAMQRFQGDRQFGFFSPYTSKAMLNEVDRGLALDLRAPDAWRPVRFHDNAFWGALATVWPTYSLKRALNHSRVLTHTHHRKVDVVIGNTCRDMGLSMMVHRPSLATHIGAVSTINRDARRFPGIQWGRYGYGFREQP